VCSPTLTSSSPRITATIWENIAFLGRRGAPTKKRFTCRSWCADPVSRPGTRPRSSPSTPTTCPPSPTWGRADARLRGWAFPAASAQGERYRLEERRSARSRPNGGWIYPSVFQDPHQLRAQVLRVRGRQERTVPPRSRPPRAPQLLQPKVTTRHPGNTPAGAEDL
jgi:hypothetical protein